MDDASSDTLPYEDDMSWNPCDVEEDAESEDEELEEESEEDFVEEFTYSDGILTDVPASGDLLCDDDEDGPDQTEDIALPDIPSSGGAIRNNNGGNADRQGGSGLARKPAAFRPCAKKPAAFQSWVPKRGKARMAMKVTKKPSGAPKIPFVPYVRHGQRTVTSRPVKMHISCALKDIYTASPAKLARMLTRSGHLRDWAGEQCPWCAAGRLGPLRRVSGRGSVHRCNRKGCQKFVTPQHNHPIFKAGWGNASASLSDKAAVCMCAAWGLSQAKCHQITGHSSKLIENTYSRLDEARMKYVLKKEKAIRFGTVDEWPDIEADEVDLGKEDDWGKTDKQKPVQWEQWGGIVERGRPHTLVLTSARLRCLSGSDPCAQAILIFFACVAAEARSRREPIRSGDCDRMRVDCAGPAPIDLQCDVIRQPARDLAERR